MSLFDLPLDELQAYRPARDEQDDFDTFWQATLRDSRSRRWPARFGPAYPMLRALEVYDVTFAGFAGQPIKAWLILPRHRAGRLPVVIEYIGYGGGRGLPSFWLTWAAAGYANLVMDTRGQGSAWMPGDTPDHDDAGFEPEVAGFLTRGISHPQRAYYRRVFTDAVMAIAAAREHPAIDPDQVILAGGSQGGGIALAATALDGSAVASCIDVPFLCHFRRATQITDEAPYNEVSQYLSVHRTKVEQVFRTLSYVDGMNFAPRATTPALFSVGLMDLVCPPSTVFAAYNHYGGPKDITIWPWNGHEAGTVQQVITRIEYLAGLGIVPPGSPG